MNKPSFSLQSILYIIFILDNSYIQILTDHLAMVRFSFHWSTVLTN